MSRDRQRVAMFLQEVERRAIGQELFNRQNNVSRHVLDEFADLANDKCSINNDVFGDSPWRYLVWALDSRQCLNQTVC